MAVPDVRLAVPNVVDPSLKVTVPLAAAGLTVAVNTVLWLTAAGLTLEFNVTEVEVRLTVWLNAEDVLVK